MAQRLFDGTKAIDIEQYPPESWTSITGELGIGNDSRNDRQEATALYELVPWLFRCVRIIQVGSARVPWAVTRGGEDVWLSEDYTPPTGLEFIRDIRKLLNLTNAALCLSPEAFWFIERNRVRPLDLKWWAPSSVIPQWDESAGLTGFKRVLGQGKTKIYPPEELVYFALPNPAHETIPGRPPGQAAMQAAGVLYSVATFERAFFDRGAIKATLLTAPPSTPVGERERLKSWWRKGLSGLGNAFRSEVISSEVVPVVVGEGLDSLGNSSLTQEKKEEIAVALGIPASIAWSGKVGGLGGGGVAKEDHEKLYDMTILPGLETVFDAINEQLLRPWGYALEMRPEQMSIYQEDERERSRSMWQMWSAGWPTDLAAEVLGYDLTDEQWARLRAYLEKQYATATPTTANAPLAPVTKPQPDPEEPENVPMDNAPKAIERQQFVTWAKKRPNADPDKFVAEYLTDQEKAAILAELRGDADGETMPPFPLLALRQSAQGARLK